MNAQASKAIKSKRRLRSNSIHMKLFFADVSQSVNEQDSGHFTLDIDDFSVEEDGKLARR